MFWNFKPFPFISSLLVCGENYITSKSPAVHYFASLALHQQATLVNLIFYCARYSLKQWRYHHQRSHHSTINQEHRYNYSRHDFATISSFTLFTVLPLRPLIRPPLSGTAASRVVGKIGTAAVLRVISKLPGAYQ